MRVATGVAGLVACCVLIGGSAGCSGTPTTTSQLTPSSAFTTTSVEANPITQREAYEIFVADQTDGLVSITWIPNGQVNTCAVAIEDAGIAGCWEWGTDTIQISASAYAGPSANSAWGEAVILHELTHWRLAQAMGDYEAVIACTDRAGASQEAVTNAGAILSGADPMYLALIADAEYFWGPNDEVLAYSILHNGQCVVDAGPAPSLSPATAAPLPTNS